jgi:hypothetical protein
VKIDDTGDFAIPDEVVDLRVLLECRQELDRLRAENELLVREHKMAMAAIEGHVAQKDELRAECDEQARLLGMSGERELSLLAEIDGLKLLVQNYRLTCGSAITHTPREFACTVVPFQEHGRVVYLPLTWPEGTRVRVTEIIGDE